MSTLNIEKLGGLVENPEFFLTGLIDKRIAWSTYVPLRLAVKRTEYVSALKIPSSSDHKLSGVASAVGTIAKAAIGFGFSKGTSGHFICKNCSLVAGQIVDFPDYSVLAIAFPYREKYIEGEIKAESKGWIWKNRVLTNIELNLNRKDLMDSIQRDNLLMDIIRGFFESQVFWMGIMNRNFDKIAFSIKNIEGRKYNIITFELMRLLKKGMDFLIEKGIDFRKIPELVFDISEKIAEKTLVRTCPYCGIETHTDYCPHCGKEVK